MWKKSRATGTVVTIFVGTSLLAACRPFNPLEDCEQNLLLSCFSSGASGSASNGGGGGTPAGCVPSENATPVAGDCGIFVSSSVGDDTNAGTKSAPMKTLLQALEKAGGRPVYTCAEELAGSVTLASGSAIYGGLDCSQEWTYVGAMKKSVLMGDPATVALTITKDAMGAEIVDFSIQGANAVAAGDSSIAVLAEEAMASFTRCELHAGDGAAGVDGEDAPSMAAQAGTPGNAGGNACSEDTVDGATPAKNLCQMETSIGGKGGDGNDVFGGDGGAGQPGALGKAGVGEPVASAWSCAIGAGQAGENGTSGTPGAGASLNDLGTLTASGFTGASGGDGGQGKIGQGGGGGGGAKGGAIACGGKPGIGGASGGSGGAGGCGGVGGKGGKGGGASIALVSLKANLLLNEVTLTTGKGGAGGIGGDPQPGGDPGTGGAGGTKVGTLNAACKGGDGGPGGNGGSGGGGRGGHTIGIAYMGTAPSINAKKITLGSAGLGGLGGGVDPMLNQGAAGLATATQEFL